MSTVASTGVSPSLLGRIKRFPARLRVAHALLVVLLAALLTVLLWLAGLLEGLENMTWSWRVRALARPSPSTPKIKLILIDQASLDWARRENKLGWPWPREVYSVMLDFCRRSQARVVAFDMLYSEPSIYGMEDDESFGKALRRTTNSVMAFFIGEQSETRADWPTNAPPAWCRAEDLGAWLTPERQANLIEPRATFPIPPVATNVGMLATIKAKLDSDGAVRRMAPLRISDGQVVPSLAVGAFLTGSGAPRTPNVHGDEIRLGSWSIPCDRTGAMIPRFRGPSGTHQAFNAAEVVQSELRLREGGETGLSTNALKDCYVFIGGSAPALMDLKPSPVGGVYPGVEIHATLLDNLLEQDLLRAAPWTVAGLVTALVAIAAGLLMTFVRHPAQGLAVFIVFMAMPSAIGSGAHAGGYWWPVAGPSVLTGLVLVGTLTLNYATEGRQRRFLRSTFGQYLSHEVIDLMIRNPEKLKLGGEKRELTMLFTDLEKFSGFSERLPAAALTALLNDYLTDMTRIVLEEGGTVDKYVGDAVVAFWNAPVDQPDHAARACRAALRCQRKLAERRAEFEQRAGAPFRMRIGINTGEVTVGNLGSESRFNYTVLGDAANLASRLEGANKFFGTFTLAAESAWRQASSSASGRKLGALRVVGRAAPVVVYEIATLAGEDLPAHFAEFHRGLDVCRQKKWAEAEQVFASFPDDPPSRLYREKCRRLAQKEEADWDMIWNLSEK